MCASVGQYQPGRGTLPYALGITNPIDEILDLTFDLLERYEAKCLVEPHNKALELTAKTPAFWQQLTVGVRQRPASRFGTNIDATVVGLL